MPCSVVIPCHNGAELTRACIQSLLAQQGGPPHEILLVDNHSSDDTCRLGSMHTCVRVLSQTTNRGFAGGVNIGLRAASAPLVLVLNNDTQAAPNLLPELRRVLLSCPRVGAVAPTSNHVKGPARIAVGELGRTDEGRRAITDELQFAPGTKQDVDTLAGLCLMLRRATLDEVGVFDERFGHGNFEDDDLSLRLRLAGYRLVIARHTFLHHEGHATFRALGLDLGAELAKRRQQFVAKWQHDAAGRAVIAAWHGDLGAAAAASRDALRTHVLWPDAHWHLGCWHAARHEHEAAARHFMSLLRDCPDSADANYELAVSQLRTGRHEAARAQLAHTVATQHLNDKTQLRLWRELGQQAYGAGRMAEAAQHFLSGLLVSPDDGDLHNWLGLCQLAQRQFEPAAKCFRAAITHGFALATTNLGICQHQLGDHDGASQSFATAVELLPHDPVARANHTAAQAALLGAAS